MSTPFAAKLLLTAAVLGCATRKDLCQRFHAVNPATSFDLERSYKWMQGVALPRQTAVYDDWAKVLGTTRPGHWLVGCSVDAFADELCALFSADRAEIEARAAQFLGRSGALRTDVRCGEFVAYSWAMSPHHRGRLIRGLLTLSPGRGNKLAASYEEGPPVGPLCFSGSAVENGRTLFLDLDTRDDPAIGRFFMVLVTPGRPLDLLGGEFVGSPVFGSEPQPTASRIALLRIDPAAAEVARGLDCYLAGDAAELATDLERMGFVPPLGRNLAGSLLTFLERDGAGLARTTVADLGALGEALAGAERPAPFAHDAPDARAAAG